MSSDVDVGASFRAGPLSAALDLIASTLAAGGHELLPAELVQPGGAADEAFRIACGRCSVQVVFDWRRGAECILATRAAAARACNGAEPQ